MIGVRGFHAREEQKGPVRAIVEGDLLLSARSFLSFFFLLSFFFSHPESRLEIKSFLGKSDVLGVRERVTKK